ncbi:MAG: hypothetical protein HYV18_01765 [Gammaproteobacteria bacterium]|nr:hypothetical protein [Gammaproteobacteria bacterium]
MLAQTAWSTLWLLMFRAGPQDFPSSPRLLHALAPLAVLANFLVFRTASLPAATALVMAVAAVAALAFVTRTLLRSRGLESRFQQTFDALLATNAILTLALLLPLQLVAPVLIEVAKDPQLLQHPPALPQTAVWTMNLLNIWNFAVTAHIFRHACGVNLWMGALVALIVTLAVLFLMILTGSLVAALL